MIENVLVGAVPPSASAAGRPLTGVPPKSTAPGLILVRVMLTSGAGAVRAGAEGVTSVTAGAACADGAMMCGWALVVDDGEGTVFWAVLFLSAWALPAARGLALLVLTVYCCSGVASR